VYREFVEEFRSESDRAAVILGVAKLDVVMYQIMQKALLPTPGSADELLDGDSPLGTFSAKINLLYRLGLIDAGFARSLHMVRKVRNAFAHEVSGCRLDSGSHGDRVKELASGLKSLGFFEDIRDHFFNGETGPAVDFRIVLSLMVARLENIFDQVEPVDFAVENSLSLAVWKDRVLDGKEPSPPGPATRQFVVAEQGVRGVV
jgi:hypothetical protein